MPCLTALTLACLFNADGLYLTGQLQVAIDQANYGRRRCDTDWCNDKIAELRLGMAVPITRTLELNYGVLHRSFYDTSYDKGEESAFLSVTWRPFRR